MVRAAMVADISAHRHRDHLVAPAARRELRALFRALQTLQRALERQLVTGGANSDCFWRLKSHLR